MRAQESSEQAQEGLREPRPAKESSEQPIMAAQSKPRSCERLREPPPKLSATTRDLPLAVGAHGVREGEGGEGEGGEGGGGSEGGATARFRGCLRG